MIFSISFSECNYDEDETNYIDALCKSGAKIREKKLVPEAHELVVVVDIESKKKFLDAFKKTDSYEFSNLCRC